MPEVGAGVSVYFNSSLGDSHFSVWGGPSYPGSHPPSLFPQLASIPMSHVIPATFSVPCPRARVPLGLPWMWKACFTWNQVKRWAGSQGELTADQGYKGFWQLSWALTPTSKHGAHQRHWSFPTTDFQFSSIMIREHTLYDFSSFEFVKICFITQHMVCLHECSTWAWKECLCCYCWVEHSINVN